MSAAADNTISLAQAKRIQRAASAADLPPPSPAEGVVPLGHDRGVYYYLSRAGKQITGLRADQHTRLALCGLASGAQYWERQQHFRSDKGTLDWGNIADWLMDQCRRVGIYDPDVVRGRGAWIDQGRAVLHLGDKLIVDGAPCPLALDGSKYVYEAARSLRLPAEAPLDVLDARKLLRITAALRWERKLSAKLLAGWIAIAPICGALAWRPSIWLTGGRGSGKSWIADNVVLAALGPIALTVQGVTSEAGIRQSLGSDARPVIFDEAEREDHASGLRMQQVLGLMRQASSETGAKIVKGTANQSGARTYQIRSAFMFQSINIGLQHQADESRVSVLALREPSAVPSEADTQAFSDLKTWAAETLTSTFSAALVARMVRLIPVARQCVEIFAQAIASVLGSRRLGDQLGTLLAGAWLLQSDEVVSPEKAREIALREEFRDLSDVEDERDEMRCLRHIFAHKLRSTRGAEYSIGRLVASATASAFDTPDPTVAEAHAMLREAGFKVGPLSTTDRRTGLFVSVRHPEIARALRDTPWGARWTETLSRLPGSLSGRCVATQRFGVGSPQRAIWIPMEAVTGDFETNPISGTPP